MCIFREFTTNSQQTEILSIHNDWRRKEHLLGNFKSFHKQMSSNLSRKRAQMATWRMSFKRHSKAFKFPASRPENDRDFGLRSIGCRHLCSESISPPPCADPGGFQVMKAQIQRGVIFAIIFSKNLPVCKPQGLHPPWPPWWGCWPPSRSAPWPCSPPRTRTPPSWASPGCCSQPDLPHILEGQSPAHCQSHNHRDPGMRASKHPFSAWTERWRSYCSIRTKGILSNEEKDQTRGQTSQSAG